MSSPGRSVWHPSLINTSTRPDHQIPGQIQCTIAGVAHGVTPLGLGQRFGEGFPDCVAERQKMFEGTTLPNHLRLAEPEDHCHSMDAFSLRCGRAINNPSRFF